MLRHLRVTNFAILSDVAIDFADGMNVLTGETGAGKSLIVEAVNLLRGGRASADIPRSGTDQAVVEAIFEDPNPRIHELLSEAGLPESDGELLVRRVIHRGGRSRTYINGALTTASRLAEIGKHLVDLSGQHQHQGLVDAARHSNILDAFMDEPTLVKDMERRYQELKALSDELAELSGDEQHRQDRIDFIRFQLEELEAADLSPGEDLELEQERDRLGAADRLEAAARTAETAVYSGDGSAVDQLSIATKELERVVDSDPRLSPVLDQLAEAQTLAEEAGRTLSGYADHIDGDPRRLLDVDDRLALIKRLTRKHGGSLDDVVAKSESLRTELDALSNSDERLEQLDDEVRAATKAAQSVARKLSRARRKAGGVLGSEVGEALTELGMSGAELHVVMSEQPLNARGTDKVEFRLAANRGETAKPLAKVASGGELSRIMLAMKLILRRAENVATYVFDEVDTGIGGTTADVVGAQIRAVAGTTQVLCVTHLPQIAALADAHFHVAKAEVEGRTETAVEMLGDKRRIAEIARMLGGKKTSARAHAAELLSSRPRP